jgi:streptogramin lyase
MAKGFVYACALTLLSGCGAGGGVFSANVSATSAFSGYVAVASSSSNTVALYNASGNFVRLLRDLNSPSSETPVGLLPSSAPGEIFTAVYGVGRIERLGLADSIYSSLFFNSNLSTAYPRGIAQDSNGNYLISSSGGWTVEKFSPAGFRVGAPFIATTVNTCVLANPYGIAVMSDGGIAVGNASANSLELYNSDGTCRAHLNAAPFNANFPRTVVYDTIHDQLIVALYSNGALYSVSKTGTGATLIYNDTTVIQNPTALAVDASGIIYVGSSSQDTIEKLSYDGTTATRVGSVPFVSASAFTLSPSAIVVVP